MEKSGLLNEVFVGNWSSINTITSPYEMSTLIHFAKVKRRIFDGLNVMSGESDDVCTNRRTHQTLNQ